MNIRDPAPRSPGEIAYRAYFDHFDDVRPEFHRLCDKEQAAWNAVAQTLGAYTVHGLMEDDRVFLTVVDEANAKIAATPIKHPAFGVSQSHAKPDSN